MGELNDTDGRELSGQVEPVVLYEVIGHVALITMNRPRQRNAESDALIEERAAAFDRAEADAEVHVIVLRAAGPTFCAGHDLKEFMKPGWREENRGSVRKTWAYETHNYFRASLRIRDCPKPTIASVQGQCIAGGFMTAAMCDLIVAADDALFMDPTLGLAYNIPSSGDLVAGAAPGVEVLFHPWQLGARKAKELLFTGDGMSAEDALRCGFVNRVVPKDQLAEHTLELAEHIATKDPTVLAITKRSIHSALTAMGHDAALEHSFLLHQLTHGLDATGGV